MFFMISATVAIMAALAYHMYKEKKDLEKMLQKKTETEKRAQSLLEIE